MRPGGTGRPLVEDDGRREAQATDAMDAVPRGNRPGEASGGGERTQLHRVP